MIKKDGNVPSTDPQIQETEELLRHERVKAQKLLQAIDDALDGLERVKLTQGRTVESSRRDTGPFRYVGVTMIDAIETFLNKVGTPQTREEIMAEMNDGGAVLAQKRPEVEVNKSIDYWLLTEAEKRYKYRKRKIKIVPPRLKEFGDDKIGLINWK